MLACPVCALVAILGGSDGFISELRVMLMDSIRSCAWVHRGVASSDDTQKDV